MNTYIINEKVRLIRKAQADYKKDFGLDYTPFTRKNFFYFFVRDNKKYVHKESLRFVYTNADTFHNDSDPTFCYLQKQVDIPDVVSFLGSAKSPLLPTLLEETSSFLVFDYIPGEPIKSLNEKDYKYIKDEVDKLELTPFYNSMTYNLLKNNNKVYLIDLKHFEKKVDIPFFIYFYNYDFGINTLYTDERSNVSLIKEIIDVDYPFDKANIIYY